MANQKTWSNIHVCLFVILIGFIAINMYEVHRYTAIPEVKTDSLTVTIISSSECKDCTDLSQIPDAITKQISNTEIKNSKTIEYGTPEAEKLISKYSITRIPAVIITGLSQDAPAPLRKVGSDYVFDATPAPYIDAETKETVGLVSLTYLTTNCIECTDMTLITGQLKQMGIAFTDEKIISADSAEGRALISKYAIKALPTLIFSKDLLDYPDVANAWAGVGSTETDGMLVMRNVPPPYKDLGTNKVKGLVTMTIINDSSCTTCYDATNHKTLIEQGFNVKFTDVKVVDASTQEGKNLISKYHITLIPTTILSKDAQDYEGLMSAWPSVGTIEADGNLVFRQINLLPGITFMNLTSGQTMSSTA